MQESASRPHAWPVTLHTPVATYQDRFGGRPAQNTKKIRVHGFRIEECNTVTDDRDPTPSPALRLN